MKKYKSIDDILKEVNLNLTFKRMESFSSSLVFYEFYRHVSFSGSETFTVTINAEYEFSHEFVMKNEHVFKELFGVICVVFQEPDFVKNTYFYEGFKTWLKEKQKKVLDERNSVDGQAKMMWEKLENGIFFQNDFIFMIPELKSYHSQIRIEMYKNEGLEYRERFDAREYDRALRKLYEGEYEPRDWRDPPHKGIEIKKSFIDSCQYDFDSFRDMLIRYKWKTKKTPIPETKFKETNDWMI